MTAIPMTPFTVEHFRQWAAELELDTGQPWIVEPFFLDFVADYFAGIPENWWIVPEGNTKTTSTAGLTVYLLEFRPRASIPWGAASRDQAEIGYHQAEGFVLGSPRLKKLLRCYPGYRRILNTATGGRLQIFAADDGTGDGIIPSDAFLDELHRHKNLRLYRTWSGKLVKRGGQLATISTAGEPGSEFEQTRERIRQETPVIESRPGYIHCRSRRIALHEYAVPEGSDVEDMAVVKLANPFSGITKASLADKFASPTMTMVHWRRMVCNLPTRSEMAAVQEVEWHGARVDEPIPEGEHIWCGLDIAWKWDTSAAVPLWMRDPQYRLLGPARILVPPRDGTQMDEDVVRRALTEIHERNPIDWLVVDPTDARELVRWVTEELGVGIVERPPTVLTRIEDFARFMEALRNGWLKHSGDRGLTQHVLNAQVHILPKGDPVFERPSQTRQGGNQELRVIDALSAAAMVHAVASAQPEPKAEVFFAWR
jgi:phage terminase large subunit-like protein